MGRSALASFASTPAVLDLGNVRVECMPRAPVEREVLV
jgi:hypothetical protein